GEQLKQGAHGLLALRAVQRRELADRLQVEQLVDAHRAPLHHSDRLSAASARWMRTAAPLTPSRPQKVSVPPSRSTMAFAMLNPRSRPEKVSAPSSSTA